MTNFVKYGNLRLEINSNTGVEIMSLQKFADQMKAKKDQMLKVFPSGKECAMAIAAGAGIFALSGPMKTTEAKDGRPGETAAVMNLGHFLGLVLAGGGASVAMAEGLNNAGKGDKKTKVLTPEEIKAARANQR